MPVLACTAQASSAVQTADDKPLHVAHTRPKHTYTRKDVGQRIPAAPECTATGWWCVSWGGAWWWYGTACEPHGHPPVWVHVPTKGALTIAEHLCVCTRTCTCCQTGISATHECPTKVRLPGCSAAGQLLVGHCLKGSLACVNWSDSSCEPYGQPSVCVHVPMKGALTGDQCLLQCSIWGS